MLMGICILIENFVTRGMLTKNVQECFETSNSFFFSSRRRHTRSLRDWSSDVCSSDLILLSNLLGLVPGFAPPTGNLNTTVGLALCSFIGYNIIGIREQGVAYLKHFIGPMTSLPGESFVAKLAFAPLMLVSICFFLILELFSHGFRPVSLSLRLFGNMMGDHEVIGAFIGLTKVIVPVAFYAMGTLVSIIQAFVFTLLSMIYVALAISHGGGHDEEHGQESHQAHH